jgi:hypothetical protein
MPVKFNVIAKSNPLKPKDPKSFTTVLKIMAKQTLNN